MTDNQVAGFWIRLGANILDGLIVSLPLTIIAGLITGNYENEPISNLIFGLYGILVPVYWNGYTIGKRMCGIRIRKFDFLEPPGLGTMLLRNLVAGIVYALTLGIGIIVSIFMVALREDKRSLHDFIAGTEVVYD
ncbi:MULTISPECIES: RDD family protein [Bacillales]|uniref:RDD family protein n=1 Tax=Bacillales TaxID=1385 RepID=UPI00017885B9|nr:MULTISPECIES: RDD family protein [Paenibacillus]ACX66609.1 RDD domain containing protein [Paenibacillus sp. Y412MC10]EGG38011.1 RDD family protein [Paenibacillus sp. HGF5]ETT60784.1 RDD domain-containing protein [Paenibacillus sp. FSL H8-457]PCL90060.1 RDD family protein [Paenibacillus lautus]